MLKTTEAAPARRGRITLSRDHLWPALIVLGLTIVLAVNAVFIYIAVTGADEVVPSYDAGQR